MSLSFLGIYNASAYLFGIVWRLKWYEEPLHVSWRWIVVARAQELVPRREAAEWQVEFWARGTPELPKATILLSYCSWELHAQEKLIKWIYKYLWKAGNAEYLGSRILLDEAVGEVRKWEGLVKRPLKPPGGFNTNFTFSFAFFLFFSESPCHSSQTQNMRWQ